MCDSTQQSIVVFGVLHIFQSMLGAAFGLGWLFGGAARWGELPSLFLLNLLGLLSLVLRIVCMVKAYQGTRFKLQLAGDIAEKLAGRVG